MATNAHQANASPIGGFPEAKRNCRRRECVARLVRPLRSLTGIGTLAHHAAPALVIARLTSVVGLLAATMGAAPPQPPASAAPAEDGNWTLTRQAERIQALLREYGVPIVAGDQVVLTEHR